MSMNTKIELFQYFCNELRIPNATMNIFDSKSGHLNDSKNCKIFFVCEHFFAIFDDFPRVL